MTVTDNIERNEQIWKDRQAGQTMKEIGSRHEISPPMVRCILFKLDRRAALVEARDLSKSVGEIVSGRLFKPGTKTGNIIRNAVINERIKAQREKLGLLEGSGR